MRVFLLRERGSEKRLNSPGQRSKQAAEQYEVKLGSETASSPWRLPERGRVASSSSSSSSSSPIVAAMEPLTVKSGETTDQVHHRQTYTNSHR
ncbi:hypothetical protein BV898_09650 [Hypsibius exemplaris]|uniref:Uncharacterized protein n=1 Tax=Hypsibius exemplaris TaxID=2072580 RepID=A0A1W0WLT5_HYPEX|nr:hypothetical protein BV898_09650 [Hypsibius exemplaris]